MQIQNKRYTKRNILLLGLPLIAIALLGSAYGYKQWQESKDTAEKTNTLNKVDYNEPTDEQLKAGQGIKENAVNNPSGKPPAPGTDENVQPTPNDSHIHVTITAASQNGDMLNVRSLIDAVTSNGTCTLTLTKDSFTISKTSGIQALANSSTCKGFDIPISELPKGIWQINLTAQVDNKTGTSTKTITIQ